MSESSSGPAVTTVAISTLDHREPTPLVDSPLIRDDEFQALMDALDQVSPKLPASRLAYKSTLVASKTISVKENSLPPNRLRFMGYFATAIERISPTNAQRLRDWAEPVVASAPSVRGIFTQDNAIALIQSNSMRTAMIFK